MNKTGSGGPVGRPVQPVDAYRSPVTGTGRPGGVGNFHAVLTERMSRKDVRFSAHAGERLRRAGVQVDAGFEQRLQEAVDKAAAKGSRSSLVLMDEMALVVSVQNRTVITAVESARMKDNVFTNIDSAVIT